MCGINGYLQYSPQLNSEQIYHLINSMNDIIYHRGPDDDGIYVKENIGFGIRRLSIIDLSTGKQPLFNEDKSLVIVFNGEIYNYKSLKEELLLKGHCFLTNTDTEVVIHCFEEYGNNCFNKLKGMFAFAIYDIKKGKVTIARDRSGEKPLYYYKKSDIILFASELKSILASNISKYKINKTAFNQYLQLTYIPAPLTIFEDIYKLLPGHYMEIDKLGNIHIEKYWDVKYCDNDLILDYNQCKSKLRSTLFNAVEECMVSDVPIGALLSGGIDSTIIVGIMSQISQKPIETFTIGYKNKQYDESSRAKAVSNLHHTNHHLYYLDYNDTLPELKQILNNIDEPFADSSYIPTYMISKYAKQYVKTVLTGDASDELFGGYNKYLISYYNDKYNEIPELIRDKVICKLVYALPDNSSHIRKIKKVIDNSSQNIFEQRRNLMCLGFKKEELPFLLNDNMIDPLSTDFIQVYYKKQDEINDELSYALYTDFKVVLEGDMLVKVDRASMLCSLEMRVPMLYKDVVELAAQIPSKYKITLREKKVILRDTFHDLIPKELVNASKKGFEVPIGKWFRNELKEDLINLLDKDKIEDQGIFNYSYIKKIMDEHFTFAKNRSSELWLLYVFETWYNNILSK